MDFNHNNVRLLVEEDRLSSLPDELIHKILSSFDMKFAVQTCVLSPRWKVLWTSMPCLNFSHEQFGMLCKFVEFVTHVLSHRNHQIEVSSMKLHFDGAMNQDFVKRIVNYAFSHNAQELSVGIPNSIREVYPPCIFSSQSLKQFTLSYNYSQFRGTTKPPFDFPALTTLNVSYITLWCDLFSKCVNLKNLTLKKFRVEGGEKVFDIITPRLSTFMLIDGRCSKVLNVIAPQLENLTIINCSIWYLNVPPELSSLCYTSQPWNYGLVEFTNERFHSLNKVSISLSMYNPYQKYTEEDARKTINMLEELQSARFLTLNAETVECISSFPDLLSHHPSPFGNLIRITIDSSKRKDACEVTMSSEASTFLLEKSPNASLIMKPANQNDMFILV